MSGLSVSPNIQISRFGGMHDALPFGGRLCFLVSDSQRMICADSAFRPNARRLVNSGPLQPAEEAPFLLWTRERQALRLLRPLVAFCLQLLSPFLLRLKDLLQGVDLRL